MGCSLRIKIQIDVHIPLKRGIFLKSGSKGEDKWIPVTYEKLPDFCYSCGSLGHTIKECEEVLGPKDRELRYGAWLREPTKLWNSEGNSSGWIAYGRGRANSWSGGRGRGRMGFHDSNEEEEMVQPPNNHTQ